VSKKRRDKHNQHSGGDGHQQPTNHCRYNPGAVQTVRVESLPNDEDHDGKEEGYWGTQIRCAKRLNAITAFGAGAAIIYALITYFQFRDVHRNFIVDQRAWLQLDERPILTFTDDNNIVAQGAVRNVGKSFALKVGYTAEVTTKLTPDEIGDYMLHPKDAVTKPSVSVIGPGQRIYMDMGAHPHPLAAESIDAIKKGTKFLFFFGTITYDDIFGGHHKTQSCLQYTNSPGGPQDCQTGNYAD